MYQAASGSWVDQVYLDPVGGPQSTTPVESRLDFTGTVNPGQNYTQTAILLHLLSTVGQYAVRVVTDSGQNCRGVELREQHGDQRHTRERSTRIYRDSSDEHYLGFRWNSNSAFRRCYARQVVASPPPTCPSRCKSWSRAPLALSPPPPTPPAITMSRFNRSKVRPVNTPSPLAIPM